MIVGCNNTIVAAILRLLTNKTTAEDGVAMTPERL